MALFFYSHCLFSFLCRPARDFLFVKHQKMTRPLSPPPNPRSMLLPFPFRVDRGVPSLPFPLLPHEWKPVFGTTFTPPAPTTEIQSSFFLFSTRPRFSLAISFQESLSSLFSSHTERTFSLFTLCTRGPYPPFPPSWTTNDLLSRCNKNPLSFLSRRKIPLLCWLESRFPSVRSVLSVFPCCSSG